MDVAFGDAPVLIRGEPGSGRAWLAELIHQAGPRPDAPFLALPARAAATLMNAAPVAELAAGGTLVLRDVSDTPRADQNSLIALLQPPGARLIATSDPGPAAPGIHPELFASARVIDVPPLRERAADIAPLFADFVDSYSDELDRGRMTVSSRSERPLTAYSWPGNVAELRTVARRAVTRARSHRIEPGDIERSLPPVRERAPLEDLSLEDIIRCELKALLGAMGSYPLRGLYSDVLAWLERPLLSLVMEHTGGNQVKAAQILGLNRNTLRRKLDDRGLLPRSGAATRRATDAT
jgi:two-component system nitrogen regulation response regulator GlnG